MKLMPTSPRRAQRILATARRLVAIACVCMGPALLSAETNEPLPVEPEPANEPTGKQCEWACERWTKMCNVDPRGVYKCRRTCAKFGEICE